MAWNPCSLCRGITIHFAVEWLFSLRGIRTLWLGHESPMTTHRYVEADLAMKEKALGRLAAPDARIRRYQAPDSLIRFLQTL
jgi:hypothetical protein